MTTEEAIKALKWKVVYAKDIGESYTDCVNIEALDTIIKALEGRPQGDSISREALKEQVKNEVCEVCFDSPDERQCSPNCKLCTFKQLIDDAQAVSDRYDEGYAQGYIDGSTGADWRGEEE